MSLCFLAHETTRMGSERHSRSRVHRSSYVPHGADDFPHRVLEYQQAKVNIINARGKRSSLVRGQFPNSLDAILSMSVRTPKYGISFCVLRCLELAVIHDLAECIVGDITPMCGVPVEEKHRREKAAMDSITQLMPTNSDYVRALYEV